MTVSDHHRSATITDILNEENQMMLFPAQIQKNAISKISRQTFSKTTTWKYYLHVLIDPLKLFIQYHSEVN